MKLLPIILVLILLVGVCAAHPMTIKGTSNGVGFITTIGIPGDGFVSISKFIGNTTSIVKVPYKIVWYRK
jgi:hypothetical protein